MASAILSSKGHITIPAEVRAALGLNPGDRVKLVEIVTGHFAIRAATYSVKCLKGTILKPETTVSIEEMNTAIAGQGTVSDEWEELADYSRHLEAFG